MLLYACLSSHGYGHASRTASVLCELAALRPHWRLVVSSGVANNILKLAFGSVPFERRPCLWDVGMVQANALAVDPPATLAALERLDGQLPDQVEAEAAWLARQGEPVAILGDVPPPAALVAARLGAPLVWLANFGWDAIYEPMGGAFAERALRCRELYATGDLLLHCPLSLPMPWGIPSQRIGVTSSRPRLDPLELARRLHLPSEPERCVLVSFGGLGLPLDSSLAARWPDHVFIGPDPTLASAPNGRILPPGVRPLDLMPLAARLITKAGYSSFCEAFSQGVGIHLVDRQSWTSRCVNPGSALCPSTAPWRRRRPCCACWRGDQKFRSVPARRFGLLFSEFSKKLPLTVI
jgi:hypothetical protein